MYHKKCHLISLRKAQPLLMWHHTKMLLNTMINPTVISSPYLQTFVQIKYTSLIFSAKGNKRRSNKRSLKETLRMKIMGAEKRLHKTNTLTIFLARTSTITLAIINKLKLQSRLVFFLVNKSLFLLKCKACLKRMIPAWMINSICNQILNS